MPVKKKRKSKVKKVYVIEYLVDDIVGKIEKLFTGKKYSHTEMFIGKTQYGLRWRKGSDYRKTKWRDIENFLVSNHENHRTVVFEVPHKFTTKQIEKMEKWWEKKISIDAKYGWVTLLTFLWRAPLRELLRLYYEYTNKPFPINLQKGKDVCSVAVDKCLKVGGYDVFEEYDEHVTYPGLFADKFGIGFGPLK